MKFVKIDDFEIQTTQVTQQQWKKVMKANPSYFKGLNLPVESISWEDCQEFIKKLNKKDKKYKYSLPTEKQWESAAKSCDDQDINTISWNWENSSKETHPVGCLAPNKLGLYDMLGNVWEWCEDLYSPNSSYRVFRGGSWYYDAQHLRSAYRRHHSPGYRNNNLGFRLVRTKITVGTRTVLPLAKDRRLEQALAIAQKALKDIEGVLK